MATMEAQVAALRSELDPSGRHSPERVWAALRALGLEPEDLSAVNDNDVRVSAKIPDPNKAEKLKCHRLDVWEGLRDSRLDELRNTLQGLGPDDVRRYLLTGDGVRAVKDRDLPEVTALAGMDDFGKMQEQKQARLKAEQQRKADQLVTGFLQEKKRMEEADAKIAALSKRLAERKAEEEAERKAKRSEAQKKEERRQQAIQRCAKERQEYEDETDAKIAEKLQRAARARVDARTKDDLRDKLAASDLKRREAFRKAQQLEEGLLAQISDKQERLEERLEERRMRVADELQMRAEASQARFHDRQLRIYAAEEEVAEEKLAKHRKFQENYRKCRENHDAALKERSKSCGDLMRKAQDKWRQNYNKERQRMSQAHEEVLGRHQAAADRLEDLTPLKLKCGNDVHSYREVKYGTWGELQRKRYGALTKSRDAHTQALLYEIAEFDKKTEIQREGHRELDRRRQLIAKETLALNDRAREGFLKIQCEADERKIHAVMTNLGFTMPTLPDEDDDQGPEASKPAY